MIKYSFLVAVYNVEAYLCQCLDSLINQNYSKSDYEIVIVDDGSEDNSALICDRYQDENSIIRVVHKQNEGLLQARKTAVQFSSGKYLVFIDSDDYVDTELLCVLDKYIDATQPDFLMYGYWRVEGENCISIKMTDREYEVLSQKEMTRLFAESEKYNGIACKVVRSELVKEHIEEIYNCSINIGEDKLQTAYLLKYSNKAVIIEDCLYYYRIRHDSIAHKKTIGDLFDVIRMYSMVRGLLDEITDDEAYSINDKNRIFSRYNIVALDGIMGHIYKYTSRREISAKEKKRCLEMLNNELNSSFLSECSAVNRVKLYNRIRYKILKYKHYNLLISIDSIIYSILRFKHA